MRSETDSLNSWQILQAMPLILLNSLLCSAFSSAWQEMRPKAENSVREKNKAD